MLRPVFVSACPSFENGICAYADGCRSELDGLEGVFDLEETSFRREGALKVRDENM
jgi:hypothetical protein